MWVHLGDSQMVASEDWPFKDVLEKNEVTITPWYASVLVSLHLFCVVKTPLVTRPMESFTHKVTSSMERTLRNAESKTIG